MGKLILYHYRGCPFCHRVWDVAEDIGIEIESRDIMRDRDHRSDLMNAMGRATVPVLRTIHEDGRDEWMPESRDIIRHLQQHYP